MQGAPPSERPVTAIVRPRQPRRLAGLWVLLTALSSPVRAEIALSGEAGVGYDSNPAQSSLREDLAFSRVALGAATGIRLSDADLGFSLDGWYRDYEGGNDSYRLALGANWSRPMASDMGLLTFSLSGVLYRDALVAADERDEAALTLRYDHILNVRDTLGLSAEVRWLAYRNASEPWSGRPGSGSGRQLAAGRGGTHGRWGSRHESAAMGLDTVEQARNDRLTSIAVDAGHDWTPTLSTRITLAHARNDSPVALESFDRNGIGLLARLVLEDEWQLEAGLGWSRCDYSHTQHRLQRKDEERTAALVIRRRLGTKELFCSLDWVDSDSTIDDRSFRQRVTQCGLAWSF